MDSYNFAELAQTLFEEAGDAMFLFDPDTEQILKANPTAQRLSGYATGELLTRKIRQLFRSDETELWGQMDQAFRKTGVFHSREKFFLRHGQGAAWIPVDLTVSRLHVQPKPLGVITARDIREQREAHVQLQLAEERLRTVITNSPVILFAVDGSGVFTLCEGKGLNAAGIKPGELLGRSVFDVFAGSQGIVQNINRVLAGEAFRAVIEMEAGPGIGHCFETHLTPIRDSSAVVVGAIGIATDVTEHRKAEKALRESEAFYHSLVESLPQNIIRKDRMGRFTFGNQRFCVTLKLPLEAIVGKTDLDLFPAPLAEKYRRDDEWVMKTGQNLEAVEEHVTPAGEKLYVQIIKSPLYDFQGKIAGTQVIFWDVTRQKRTDQRLAVQHAVARTLADAASVRGTLAKILQVICEVLDWAGGMVWRVDRRANVLTCAELWPVPLAGCAEFESRCRQVSFAAGIGLPGRIWATGQPAWVTDVAAADDPFHKQFALEANLIGFYGFPMADGRGQGVIEFFSRDVRLPDDELVPIMTNIGSQVGQFIIRRQAEKALAEERNLLRTLRDHEQDPDTREPPRQGQTQYQQARFRSHRQPPIRHQHGSSNCADADAQYDEAHRSDGVHQHPRHQRGCFGPTNTSLVIATHRTVMPRAACNSAKAPIRVWFLVPSMRFRVKPHSGILCFLAKARTVHAHDRPACLRVLASSVLAFFHPRRSPLTRGWGRAAGVKECSVSADASTRGSLLTKALLSAGVFYGPSSAPGQPSIRVTPATGATTFYLVRAERTERQITSLPIERTVPLQVTRRHNGDSLRLALLASSAVVTSLP